MLTRRLIPCLDTRDGRVVKGVRFAALRDVGDPVALAAGYATGGADELVLLDVAATVAARRHRLDTLAAVRRVVDIPLCAGGGVRDVRDAAALLGAGADKVAVNSAAVANPTLLRDLAGRFGRQCVVLAIDARRTPAGHTVHTHAGARATALEAAAWAAAATELGAGEILLTSIDRDGTGAGYDLELLARVRAATNVPIIASGGAASVAHLLAALRTGADAVLLASLLHDGHAGLTDLKSRLRDHELPFRPC